MVGQSCGGGFGLHQELRAIVRISEANVPAVSSLLPPTMRLRLDRLIEKIRLNDNETEDPFILLVKSLAIDDRYDVDTARILIDEYRKRRDES